MLKFVKAPGEILDFAIDWTAPLEGDEIVTSAWIVPDGITKTKDGRTSNVCTVWLSGGQMRGRYTVVNRVTTTGGRTLERRVVVTIEPK